MTGGPRAARLLLLAGLAALVGCGFDEGALQTEAGAAPAVAGTERPSLASLANGDPPPPQPTGGAGQVGRAKPLVVIRFDDPNVDYEEALYAAVSGALERRPGAGFDVVAVAPVPESAATLAAGRRAAEVARALAAMGLPAERLSLSATTTPQAAGQEVHLYVR